MSGIERVRLELLQITIAMLNTTVKAGTSRILRRTACYGILVAAFLPATVFAQSALTWQQIKDLFADKNPTLKAARLNIDESRAAEITAYLRPNPGFDFSTDGTQLTRYNGVWRPFAGTQMSPGFNYLHERKHKRELRRDQAKESTAVAEWTYLDQDRGLVFALRGAFVQTLQSKAVLQNAKENLDYWDKELGVNRVRYNAGDLAQVDLDRLELQRAQFESDFETAIVNLRTAKIQLLMLLNDRIPIEQFDISGPFDYVDRLRPLEEYRNIALEARPDLKASVQNVVLADITHKLAVANGSTDPTFSAWWTHNPSFNNPFDNNTIGLFAGLPGCGESLSGHPIGLLESDWIVLDSPRRKWIWPPDGRVVQ